MEQIANRGQPRARNGWPVFLKCLQIPERPGKRIPEQQLFPESAAEPARSRAKRRNTFPAVGQLCLCVAPAQDRSRAEQRKQRDEADNPRRIPFRLRTPAPDIGKIGKERKGVEGDSLRQPALPERRKKFEAHQGQKHRKHAAHKPARVPAPAAEAGKQECRRCGSRQRQKRCRAAVSTKNQPRRSQHGVPASARAEIVNRQYRRQKRKQKDQR